MIPLKAITRTTYPVGLIVCLLALLIAHSGPAFAEPRLALVIGNAAYGGNNKLNNPVNDAQDMAAVLRQVGFEVTEVYDAGLRKMKETIQTFGQKLQQKGGVGLFYFSGHGVQYAGENYLIPIGATETITAVGHFQYEALPAGYVLATMEDAKNKVNIVILDACRDNPFKSLFRGSGPEGLAAMPVPNGSLIAYSTRPGKRALDGSGRNSPYVKYLKQELPKRGASVQDMLTNVRVAVMNETHSEQAPGYYSELNGPFCFVGPCGQQAGPSVAQTPATETPSSPPTAASTPPAPTDNVFRDTLRNGSQGPEMVRIRGGRFLMGSPADEKGRDENEHQHEVQVADFAIGKYEVTVGQFKSFVKATQYKTEVEKNGGCNWSGSKTWRNPGFSQTDDHPVVCVSWYDAMAYVDWLSKQTDQKYRLPTEAEWEYAARAGTTMAYYWGDDPDKGCTFANGADQTSRTQLKRTDILECQDGYVYTAPVGHFGPNAWGLYDMLGNAKEWTCSAGPNHKDYDGSEQRCLSKGDTDSCCVFRGGSWYDALKGLRGAARSGYQPLDRSYGLGFRLARK